MSRFWDDIGRADAGPERPAREAAALPASCDCAERLAALDARVARLEALADRSATCTFTAVSGDRWPADVTRQQRPWRGVVELR